MHVIGLTGGIGTGKSTVSSMLAQHGAAVVDADRLGHRTYEPGTATFRQVRERFGPEVVAADGAIDRRVLGEKVFGRPEQMSRLTAIVWPAIRSLAQDEIRRLAADGMEVVVLEAAVLIEAGWQDLADEVWVVTAPPEVARERLMQRNALSAAEADRRIASQVSDEDRLAHADVVLNNDGSLDHVRELVQAQWRALQERLAPVR